MFYINILLQLLFPAAVASWSVSYNPGSMCALERASVDFSCMFDCPDSHRLKTTYWFKPEAHQKQDGSQVGISVYNSEPAKIHQLYKNRTTYANRDKNCSLQLHNVSKSDTGMYFFRFETYSSRGKYTGWGGIKLTVAVLPFRVTVKTKKVNEHIQEGDPVALTCSTENCILTQEPFAWFKNQRLIPEATGSVLQITSVSSDDFGYYSCGLKNIRSASADEVLLDVRYSPKNVKRSVLPSGKIQEGNSLTLICESNANPAVTNYSWFMIKEAYVSYIGSDREFSIKSASQKDDGQYFCTAKNDMGSQNSTVTALKVEVASNRNFFLTAAAVFLFLTAVLLLVMFGLIIRRRKQFTSKKQPTEQTPAVTVTEEIYENLRKSPESEDNLTTNVLYVDLRLASSTSDRPPCKNQENDTVIYSLLSYKH
ncbi:B-cell receptor CD22-like isoform X5 [Carassius gibelio]|uniref:B-cell receptor CD22-like isoform X1 n=1 Tax=Carassius gibelio TaxID=101364 RepID=UPI00227755F3|nr:B-cell receptor CD22-like isoform X1 [Carassius gibelio]XP_052434027.1 B-cell receptor CD22-like isoform X5 [Carassius gibelio]